MNQQDKRTINILLGVALLILFINILILAALLYGKSVILVEHKNQTCQGLFGGVDTSIDTSYVNSKAEYKQAKYIEGLEFNEDLYCYSAPSEPKCHKIILKNGTEIIQYPCLQNANLIIKCINKNDINETT